jgi:ketosteroid isomerase-like protein
MSEQNKELVRRYITEMWQEGNKEVVDDLFDTSIRYMHDEVLPSTRTSSMRPSLLYEIGANREVFGNLQVEVGEIVAEDQQVIAHWLASGTHSGPARFSWDRPLVEPTERQLAAEVITFARVSDGQIYQLRNVWSPMSLLQQLALLTTDYGAERLLDSLAEAVLQEHQRWSDSPAT